MSSTNEYINQGHAFVYTSYGSKYTRHYGLDTYGLRYFNVFGRRQNPDGAYAAVIPKFTEKICAGESPTVFGDGEQTRDFVFVKDVARANLLAMDSAVCGLFNIGTGVQTSLNDLAKMIMDAAGVSVEMKYEAAREAQGLLELQIAKLQNLVANARVIDESQIGTDKVQMLNKVKIKNLKI